MKGIDLKSYRSQLETEPAPHAEAGSHSVWQREVSLGNPFKLKDRQQFYQLLGILLSSGLGVLDCLLVLKDQLKGKTLIRIVDQLHLDLSGGFSLSEAMTRQEKFFSPFERQSIRMGEKTGRMDEVLNRISIFYEQRLRLRRKVVQALSYPVAVVVVALLVLTFMIAFVVPMFEDVFARFEASLPPITQGILGLSAFLQAQGGWLLLGLALIIGSILLLRRKEVFRRLGARALLKIPVIGSLFLKLQLARLCYTLSLLLRAKVNLDQALALMDEIVSFYPLQQATQSVRTAVIEGSSLYEAVAQHAIFPRFFTQIIRVGEQTARLDELLETLAHNLEEESQAGVSQMTQFLEPLLIIVLGVMVATILVAMYLPMFELSNAISTF